MLSCNFYLSKEEVNVIEQEIEFLSNKTALSREQVIEFMKIGLLSGILKLLEKKQVFFGATADTIIEFQDRKIKLLEKKISLLESQEENRNE